MHHCLHITEMQSAIFDLCQPFQEHDTPATLVNLARTCTAFKETALNVLWRELYLLGPLIQVMPDDLWTVEIYGVRSARKKVLKFTRPLKESDFLRFDNYAPRIHRLGWTAFPSNVPRFVYVHEDTFQALESYRSGQPLLTHLRAFNPDLTEIHSLRAIKYMSALLAHSITEIRITWLVFLDDLPELYLRMANCCPNIQSLTIESLTSGKITPKFSSALQKLILALARLENLTLVIPSDKTTSNITHHLGSFTALRQWKTRVPSNLTTLRLHDLFTTKDGRFTSLCHVTFKARTAELAADAITPLQCALEHLSVNIEGSYAPSVPSFSSLTTVIDAITNHRCATTLTYLSLFGLPAKSAEVSPHSICNVFSSLFSLKALQTIEMKECWCTPALDDDWFAGAALAWPHLQVLNIHDHNTDTLPPPVVTLAGLVPLIRNCLQLSDLHLSFCAKPFDCELLHPGICNTKITYLDVGTSPIVDPVDVFQSLIAMFPNLESIYYSFTGLGDGEDDPWQKVSRLIEEDRLQECVERDHDR